MTDYDKKFKTKINDIFKKNSPHKERFISYLTHLDRANLYKDNSSLVDINELADKNDHESNLLFLKIIKKIAIKDQIFCIQMMLKLFYIDLQNRPYTYGKIVDKVPELDPKQISELYQYLSEKVKKSDLRFYFPPNPKKCFVYDFSADVPEHDIEELSKPITKIGVKLSQEVTSRFDYSKFLNIKPEDTLSPRITRLSVKQLKKLRECKASSQATILDKLNSEDQDYTRKQETKLHINAYKDKSKLDPQKVNYKEQSDTYIQEGKLHKKAYKEHHSLHTVLTYLLKHVSGFFKTNQKKAVSQTEHPLNEGNSKPVLSA